MILRLCSVVDKTDIHLRCIISAEAIVPFVNLSQVLTPAAMLIRTENSASYWPSLGQRAVSLGSPPNGSSISRIDYACLFLYQNSRCVNLVTTLSKTVELLVCSYFSLYFGLNIHADVKQKRAIIYFVRYGKFILIFLILAYRELG